MQEFRKIKQYLSAMFIVNVQLIELHMQGVSMTFFISALKSYILIKYIRQDFSV